MARYHMILYFTGFSITLLWKQFSPAQDRKHRGFSPIEDAVEVLLAGVWPGRQNPKP